jgi:hypothetical protein
VTAQSAASDRAAADFEADEKLRAEADRLLRSGLLSTLSDYGEVHVIGSYALRLMAWRDLDVHIVQEQLDPQRFFELGGRIAELLKPQRMHFSDEARRRRPGLPPGLYWGIYLGDERAGAWKIDVWATERVTFEPIRLYGEELERRLSDATRATILRIKSECWRDVEYRRRFTSTDIYSAVLDHGIVDVAGLRAFLSEHREKSTIAGCHY